MTAPPFETRGQWLQALALALAAHGAGAAAFLDLRSDRQQSLEPGPIPVTQIEVTSLAVETGSLTPAESVEADDGPAPGGPTEAESPPQPEIALAPVTPVLPDRAEPVTVAPGASLAPVTAPMAGGGDAVTPVPTDAPGDPVAAPPPALAALIAAVRDRLAEPCLIALPRATPAGEVELTVLGAEDQGIAGFIADVAGQAAGVSLLERSVLLDQRQCPALAYARGAATYPAGPVAVTLAEGVVASGGHLLGTVHGLGPGDQVAVVLVDDNGVVQDLARFGSRGADGSLRLDVPVRREGAARDTSQIVIALAGPGMAQAAAQNAGQRAGDFFAALGGQPGPNVRVAVAAFYLR